MEAKILYCMNRDHKVCIDDILVVYGGVKWDDKITNIEMTSVDTKAMTISYTRKDADKPLEKVVAFEPPLEDLKDCRVRLVEMSKFAAHKRGFAPHQVWEYRYPSLAQWIIDFAIYLPLWCYFFPSVFDNSVVLSVLRPSQVQWIISHSIHITLLTFFIHALEVIFILRPKVVYYRLPKELRPKWYISGVIEGYGALKRLDEAIAYRISLAR